MINSVSSSSLTIVQENGTASGTDTFGLSGSTVTANGYTPVIGWLRNPALSPRAAGKLAVAATAQHQLGVLAGR